MTKTIFDADLDRNPANFQPLTPLTFLERAAAVFPQRVAIVHGARSWTYGEFYARARRLASALAKYGISRGDTVSVMLANTPAMQIGRATSELQSLRHLVCRLLLEKKKNKK